MLSDSLEAAPLTGARVGVQTPFNSPEWELLALNCSGLYMVSILWLSLCGAGTTRKGTS